jgi:hypothetical protein
VDATLGISWQWLTLQRRNKLAQQLPQFAAAFPQATTIDAPFGQQRVRQHLALDAGGIIDGQVDQEFPARLVDGFRRRPQ